MEQNIDKEKWSDDEIKRAAKTYIKAEKNKHLLIKILDQIVHWFAILLILFGNLIISVVLIFVSGLVTPLYFYVTLVLFALGFGALMEISLQDIEKLDKNKHFLSRIVLPLLVIVNIYILIGIKNVIEQISSFTFNFNPIYAGITYGVVFLIPHFIWMIRK